MLGVFHAAAVGLPFDPADSAEDMQLVPEPAFDPSKVACFAAPVCALASEPGGADSTQSTAVQQAGCGERQQQQEEVEVEVEGARQVVVVMVAGLAGFCGRLRLVAFADGCLLADQWVAKGELRQDVLRWGWGWGGCRRCQGLPSLAAELAAAFRAWL